MLNRFLESIDSLNLRELAFELIWDKYTDDDISSVINIPVWEPIDDVLCSLARRIRVTHPERRLSVVLSLVAPQTTDLGKVKLGSLFRKFREEGTINLQYFIDHLPPVSSITILQRVETYSMFWARAYTPQICLCLQ